MSATASWLSVLLVRDLRGFARELELFRTEDEVWETLPGVTNSAGNLALHVCGNLQHFVGSVLGKTGYTRDREAEFSTRSVPREALAAGIADAVKVVEAVVPGLSDETLSETYPLEVAGGRLPTGLFLLHLSTHLAHHLGQAGYLRRVLEPGSPSAGVVSLAALVTPVRADRT